MMRVGDSSVQDHAAWALFFHGWSRKQEMHVPSITKSDVLDTYKTYCLWYGTGQVCMHKRPFERYISACNETFRDSRPLDIVCLNISSLLLNTWYRNWFMIAITDWYKLHEKCTHSSGHSQYTCSDIFREFHCMLQITGRCPHRRWNTLDVNEFCKFMRNLQW